MTAFATIVGALLGGIFTYLIAPVVKWNIDRRKQVYDNKVLMVKQWREMIASIYKSYSFKVPEDGAKEITTSEFDVLLRLSCDQNFWSLKPHLSEDIQDAINRNNIRKYQSHGRRNTFLFALSSEVARIENEWKLLDEQSLMPWYRHLKFKKSAD